MLRPNYYVAGWSFFVKSIIPSDFHIYAFVVLFTYISVRTTRGPPPPTNHTRSVTGPVWQNIFFSLVFSYWKRFLLMSPLISLVDIGFVHRLLVC